jgi:hypothetical protein
MNCKNQQKTVCFKAKLQSWWFLLGNHRLPGGGGRQNLAGEAFRAPEETVSGRPLVICPFLRDPCIGNGVREASREMAVPANSVHR